MSQSTGMQNQNAATSLANMYKTPIGAAALQQSLQNRPQIDRTNQLELHFDSQQTHSRKMNAASSHQQYQKSNQMNSLFGSFRPKQASSGIRAIGQIGSPYLRKHGTTTSRPQSGSKK